MPWHWEPMKDVTSCEKLRGAANRSEERRVGKECRFTKGSSSEEEYMENALALGAEEGRDKLR